MFEQVYLNNVVTLKLDAEKCNGCKMCIDVCPHNVYEFISGKAVPARRNSCMECGACALNCKQGAITVRSGVGCAVGILNGILRNSEPTCGCDGEAAGCC